MTVNIQDVPFEELVRDWADAVIDLYYCDLAIRSGVTTYMKDGQPWSIAARRADNQRIADKIILEFDRRGKTIPDLAAVMEAVK